MATIHEASKAWRRPHDLLHFLARSGRIPGAHKNEHGRWQIPDHILKLGPPHPGGAGEKHRQAHQDHLDAQVIGRSR